MEYREESKYPFVLRIWILNAETQMPNFKPPILKTPDVLIHFGVEMGAISAFSIS